MTLDLFSKNEKKEKINALRIKAGRIAILADMAQDSINKQQAVIDSCKIIISQYGRGYDFYDVKDAEESIAKCENIIAMFQKRISGFNGKIKEIMDEAYKIAGIQGEVSRPAPRSRGWVSGVGCGA
ncbi:MAG: hypothetical protein LBJ18_03130, partial [Rickettsiales bacterium]|nr:hypothetical protein [Rickettsiales bacterium]